MDKRWEDIVRNLENEAKRVVEYVDREVVPAARKEAHIALKNVAQELDKLADRLHDKPTDADKADKRTDKPE